MAQRCNLCDGDNFQSVCAPEANGLSIVRCEACGLLFADPFPKENQVLERYNGAYFHCNSPLEGGYEDYVSDEPLVQKTFKRRLRLFRTDRSRSEKPKVLDVGCATGVFLEVMREQKWDPYGIEVSTFAAERAQAKKLSVIRGQLTRESFPTESFDLITLWDVIEHVLDPLELLKTCHALLKPGGLLVITTPDASSFLAKLLGRYWLGYRCVGEHLYFFGRSSMRAYLQKAGFDSLKLSAIGKYLSWDRLITRLVYYTRIFRVLSGLERFLPSQLGIYVNSGDTMAVVARKPLP